MGKSSKDKTVDKKDKQKKDKDRKDKKDKDTNEEKKRKRPTSNTEQEPVKRQKIDQDKDGNSKPLLLLNKSTADQKSEPKLKEIQISENDVHPPVTNYRVSPSTVAILAQNGINTLFPIQASSFDFVFDGSDIVGRARTGTGKTLSFSLPVIERMLASTDDRTSRGRPPRMIVLAPTRELAQQVEKVIAMLCQNKLKSLCVFGGAPIFDQKQVIRGGIDVLVGTPGRVIDLLERGDLNLTSIKYFVLDEADEMLNMGFREDIEKIMETTPKEKQTLLYSATIPEWVQGLSKKYLNKSFVTVDLVGSEKVKTATTVKHYYIVAAGKPEALLASLVKAYSKGGKTMVFCETKVQANQVGLSSSISSDCQVLHGDIVQSQREVTMQSFRDGKFSILVCTDVAARGLDVTGVDLVIHWTLPKENESYIHRSGRTGRAGTSGVSIAFCNPRQIGQIKMLEQAIGTQIVRVGPPSQSDVHRFEAEKAIEDIKTVAPSQVKMFLPYAQQAFAALEHAEFNESNCLDVLARAFAVITGCTSEQAGRSVLTAREGFTTLLVSGKWPFYKKGDVFSALRTLRVEHCVGDIRLTKDNKAVCDIPSAELSKIPSQLRDVEWQTCTELPDVIEDEPKSFGNRSPGRFGGGGRDNRNGGGRDNRNGGGRFQQNRQGGGRGGGSFGRR